MPNSDFYVLVSRLEGEAATEFLMSDTPVFGDAPACTKCGLFLGARVWLPPYRVELQTHGHWLGDIAFGGPEQLLVSTRFKDIFVKSGLKGLDRFEPVQVTHFGGSAQQGRESWAYLKVDVYRGNVAIDPVASGVEWEGGDFCPCCLLGNRLKRRRRIVIDELSWSGEDIFFARGLPGQFIVSSRFKRMCEANDITNAVMVPAIHRR